MNTINISLPSKLREQADELVKQGYYVSISDLVRDAIRKTISQNDIPFVQLSEKANRQFEEAEDAYMSGKTTDFESISELV